MNTPRYGRMTHEDIRELGDVLNRLADRARVADAKGVRDELKDMGRRLLFDALSLQALEWQAAYNDGATVEEIALGAGLAPVTVRGEAL